MDFVLNSGYLKINHLYLKTKLSSTLLLLMILTIEANGQNYLVQRNHNKYPFDFRALEELSARMVYPLKVCDPPFLLFHPPLKNREIQAENKRLDLT